MSDDEIVEKINLLKNRVKDIVDQIQYSKKQLSRAEISLDVFKNQKTELESELREILKRISLLKESIQFSLRIQKETKIGEQTIGKQVDVSEKAKELLYYFKTEFDDLVNKASIYLSGYFENLNVELGFFELFFPPIAPKNSPFEVTGLLAQRGAEELKVSVTLSENNGDSSSESSEDQGIVMPLSSGNPQAVSFKINATSNHIYSLRAKLLEINGIKIDENNSIYFDFEVKILPFDDFSPNIEFFDTKTGRYLIYTYLACDKEQNEHFLELQHNLKHLGVSNFEPLIRIIPGFKKTQNLLKLGQNINETIIFLIENFKRIQNYYKYEKIDDLEKKLLHEAKHLFKFASEGIILKPLENLDNALQLSMLFRCFFKVCKLGLRKLFILKTILDIGKLYNLDISDYLLYIKNIKKIPMSEIE